VIQGRPGSLPLSFLDLHTVEGHDLRKEEKEELWGKIKGRGGR
jgi:hypothetical protein